MRALSYLPSRARLPNQQSLWSQSSCTRHGKTTSCQKWCVHVCVCACVRVCVCVCVHARVDIVLTVDEM